jgi:N-acetylglutamate synthase-like GNAT family acetyltransferase
MANWKLRRAEPQDAPALARCFDAAYQLDPLWSGRSIAPTEENYNLVIALYQVWVAVDQGQVIGGLVLIPKEDHMLLANIAVRPEHQGTGVGQVLLELADAEALDQGYQEIRLSTNKAMIDNLDMYRRSGWTEMQSGGPEVHNISMRKLLR